MSKSTISLSNEFDFSKSCFFPTANFTKATTLEENKWIWDSTINVARGKSLGGTKGYFTLNLGYVKQNDILNVECLMRTVEGDKCKFNVAIEDEFNLNPTYLIEKSTVTNDLEIIKAKVIVPKDGNLRVDVGLWTIDTGIFEIKYIKCDLESTRNENVICKVNKLASQSIPNGPSFQKILFDNAIMNNRCYFDKTNSSIVIKENGLYSISGMVNFLSNVTGVRDIAIVKNNEVVHSSRQFASQVGGTRFGVNIVEYLVTNDVITLSVNQESGGTLTIDTNEKMPFLTVAKI